MVPQLLLLQISIRPSRLLVPVRISLRSPRVQAIVDNSHSTVSVVWSLNVLELEGEHLRPASSPWTQLCTSTPLFGQSQILGSVPLHATLSKRMAPVPCPKKALEKTTKPVRDA